MKKKIQSLLQKILGFENYLFYCSRYKIFSSKYTSYEPELIEFMNRIPQGTILDIGANIGITTVALAKRFPTARIHSFEPIPANNTALKRVIKHFKLKNVQLHEIALGEEAGELKLVVPIIKNVRMQGLSHAYIEGNDEDLNRGDIYNIPMGKLDDIKELKAEQKIGAIKIDVENFEYYVLKGGKQLLELHKPIIYCELWDNDMRPPVLAFLKELGYTAKIVENKKLVDFTDQIVINFILIHKSSLKD